MEKRPYSLRLDPWSAEYDGSIQIGDDEPGATVDVSVEVGTWEPIRPGPRPPAAPLFFVDGVRRIEHRLLVEDGGRTLFGLLGSFGVGAVEASGGARIARHAVGRVACVGGGLRIARFEVALCDRGARVDFEAVPLPDNTPVAPVEGLQKAMREAEAALAGDLTSLGGVVFLDGPLTYATGAGPVVGYVKRLLRSYLPASEAAILTRLAVGERTPLFLIEDARSPRYSCYVRIGAGRAIDSPLAGVVRLELLASLGIAAARGLADLAASELPRFASDPAHDPRAPQNLTPIGALETRLRHLLGDATLLRRAIEARLHSEVSA